MPTWATKLNSPLLNFTLHQGQVIAGHCHFWGNGVSPISQFACGIWASPWGSLVGASLRLAIHLKVSGYVSWERKMLKDDGNDASLMQCYFLYRYH